MQLEPEKEEVKNKDTCRNDGLLLSRFGENYKHIMRQWSVHQEDVTIPIMCVSDNIRSTGSKMDRTERRNRQTQHYSWIFQYSLSMTDRKTDRKELGYGDLSSLPDLIVICQTLPKTAEYALLCEVHTQDMCQERPCSGP